MPRAEKGSIKDLANKMKAKGLQKLRWYCQMCQKQCRDENGFKCHTSSESHQRQLLLFADNPGRFLDEFSKEFADGYVDLLKRRFGTRRVNANQVYQEYISDRNHLHMNATKWLSLTGFVKYLGREGKAIVDETEKGWFVTWIDRDPETLARQEAIAKKHKMDKDDEERLLDFVEKQVERAKQLDREEEGISGFTELKRENSDEKIVVKLGSGNSTSSGHKSLLVPSIPNVFALASKSHRDKWETSSTTSSSTTKSISKRPKTALEQIREEEERRKAFAAAKKNRRSGWLSKGLIVKIISKRFGDKYYSQKGVVTKVFDSSVPEALIKLLKCGTTLKVDQERLETVIPSPGGLVMILDGEYRGSMGLLEDVNKDDGVGSIYIKSEANKGRMIKNLPFDKFCKLSEDD